MLEHTLLLHTSYVLYFLVRLIPLLAATWLPGVAPFICRFVAALAAGFVAVTGAASSSL